MEKTKKTPIKKTTASVKKTTVKAAAPVKKAVAVKHAATMAKPVSAEKSVSAPVKRKLSEDQVFGLIRDKAYELFVLRGCVAGSDLGDWYEAEMIVRKEFGL